MTTYTNIQANTQSSEPLTTTVVTALDRNLYALCEGDPSASVVAQLEEPAIKTNAVRPSKISPSASPTGVTLGVYTNAIPVSTIGMQMDRTSTTDIYETSEQTISRSGGYVFWMRQARESISGNLSCKTELIVNGVIRSTISGSNTNINWTQKTLSVSAGAKWFIRNTYVSGSGTTRLGACAVCLMKDVHSTDEMYIDRGLYEIFGLVSPPRIEHFIGIIDQEIDWNQIVYYPAPVEKTTGWFEPLLTGNDSEINQIKFFNSQNSNNG
tara:strand:+ start:8139 stop:8942 length:804 start_codon:yes stop_codon:yes gene_type:complete